MTHSATFSGYAAQLREFIRAGVSGDERFNHLAGELFRLQFTHNAAYRRFCEARGISPDKISDWRQIPAMPTAAFKELEVTSLPVEQRARAFHSSGTTAQRPSRHFHNADSLAIYEASLLPWFRQHLLPEAGRADFLFLTPSPEQSPNSSLVHMFETVSREFGLGEALFCGMALSDGAWELDWELTRTSLENAIASNRPLIVLGTAFNFVHLTDRMQGDNLRLKLPVGSRAMETGGYKGRSREMAKTELHAFISHSLGISPANIICEYGMSELSSQAYDGVVGNGQARRFHFPPWARVQIVSPETGREAAEGETGLIRIFDLANVYSVMAIQMEDLGARRGDGFELLGRVALAESRGCSLQSA
ncbi:MAG TPA: hypothetical protein VH413_14830 [Verrucomicrobiae bacterium]|nr:hypothetical protein [Verrucomicrobiae bacterium]